MSTRSIEKLRRRFILIATMAFVIVALFIGGCIYIANVTITRNSAENAIDYIIKNEGDLPDDEEGVHARSPYRQDEDSTESSSDTAYDRQTESSTEPVSDRALSSDTAAISPSIGEIFGTARDFEQYAEFSYITRYFAVIFSEDDQAVEIKTSHIAALDDAQAVALAHDALDKFFSFGHMGVYYYKVADLDDGRTIVVFLDSTDALATNYRLLYITLILLGFGMIAVSLIVRILSHKVVQPEIENAERQKQFITNASHELKTPLAVIRANTEVDQMINGENEWNQSTMRQVDRMTGLIANLVTIARAEEKSSRGPLTDVDVTKAVQETIETFSPVASQEGKTLTGNLQENVTMNAEEGEIRQLASLLIDNAIKYCDDDGAITVMLVRGRGPQVKLSVSNNYAEGANTDYSRFFDRFYRKDESHSTNTEKGGYGIGLSIAESLVTAYNGTIDASWKDGVITFTCIIK